ncbi:MAG: SH3 domain-containing protein [Anaerolineales bacterium]
MTRLNLFSIFALLILTGCATATAQPTPTVDADAILKAAVSTASARLTDVSTAVIPTPSATLKPTRTLKISDITSTSAPLPAPVDGVSASNVTVRSEPRKGADNLGGIFFNHSVQVIARNEAANWYYIEWPKSPTGAAWVVAPAINLKGSDITLLPIAIIDNAKNVTVLPPLLWTVTGTPLPLNTPAAGDRTALITQLAKVRVGPGIGYSTMGTLDPGVVVVVTGHINQNGWIQIGYPSGPGGRGWVAGELAKPNVDLGGLPFYNLLATPVSDAEAKGELPTADPNATPEATLTPAPTLAGPTGVVKATELNVHGGPASTFALLGTLKLGDHVVVTGLTLNHLWYRIVYPDGPGGYGFVSVQYIRITGGDMTKLPYLDNLGTPVP